MIVGSLPRLTAPAASAAGSFFAQSAERLEQAPYGDERDAVSRKIMADLERKPGMKTIVENARKWGVEEDDFALQRLLEDLDKGERSLRKLALHATPILAERSVKREQLAQFDPLACRLWDATSSKQLQDSIYSGSMYAEEADPPLAAAWSLKTHMRFTNASDKEAIAGVFFEAIEKHPGQRWVTQALDDWGLTRNWATLEKASEMAFKEGRNQLALLVIGEKDFAAQQRALKDLPVARALHGAVAENKRSHVWSFTMRKPTEGVAQYMGGHYSSGKTEDQAVYGALWPTLRETPAGELMERWGLTNIEAVKMAAHEPHPKDRWQFALMCTPKENVPAMQRQLAELEAPTGKLVHELMPHFADGQVRTLWERALRQKSTPADQVENWLVLTLNQVGVAPEQSLPLVQRFWKDFESTSEQIKFVQTLHGVARGEGLNYLLDKLIARPIMSDQLRAEFRDLRATEKPDWGKVKGLLTKLAEEARQEDAMRRMMGEKIDPSKGIQEGHDSVQVGGIRVPKRKASPA